MKSAREILAYSLLVKKAGGREERGKKLDRTDSGKKKDKNRQRKISLDSGGVPTVSEIVTSVQAEKRGNSVRSLKEGEVLPLPSKNGRNI